MATVRFATTEDIDDLVSLESALFVEDAGRHDPYADTSWPARKGHQDLAQLIDSPDGIVLCADHDGAAVGLLAGFATSAGETSQPVDYAVLRTMYVAPSARRLGVATMLTERFIEWALARGCVEAHVSHYAANVSAARLYQRCGFGERGVVRVRPLA